VFQPPPGLDETVVQMHLSHRLVQRLLGRFNAQGFVLHELSRACLIQSEDRIPRVVLLGRLAVFGPRASRLHEELLTVTAQWTNPQPRSKPLAPFAREAEAKTMAMLENSLAAAAGQTPPESIRTQLAAAIPQNVADLLPHLASRGTAALEDAQKKLTARGESEVAGLVKILEDQRKRVQAELAKGDPDWMQTTLPLDDEVRKQTELERKQRRADMKYWQDWLTNVEGDLKREPERIRDFYSVKSHRIEPLGIVYLWPA